MKDQQFAWEGIIHISALAVWAGIDINNSIGFSFSPLILTQKFFTELPTLSFRIFDPPLQLFLAFCSFGTNAVLQLLRSNRGSHPTRRLLYLLSHIFPSLLIAQARIVYSRHAGCQRMNNESSELYEPASLKGPSSSLLASSYGSLDRGSLLGGTISTFHRK